MTGTSQIGAPFLSVFIRGYSQRFSHTREEPSRRA